MPDKLMAAIGGISGILVAPFTRDDTFDANPLLPIVDRAINAGVHVLVANGNTGEFYGLTQAEAESFVHGAGEMIGGRVPLVAGVGKSIKDAVALAKVSVQAGAQALMVHQPPDPFVSPRAIVEYVKRVHDASGLPLVLYLRNDTIGTEAIVDLCEVAGVIAVKWATPNPIKLAEAMAASPKHIVWVGGLAEIWAPVFYAVGARGFTSGLVNVWPQRSVAIYDALESHDFKRALTLIADMKAFEEVRAEEMNGTNVTAVKAALALTGNDCGACRPPSAWPLTSKQLSKLESFLSTTGLI
jgi:4-hydroxy-tetrahydrodipicolinate synthase